MSVVERGKKSRTRASADGAEAARERARNKNSAMIIRGMTTSEVGGDEATCVKKIGRKLFSNMHVIAVAGGNVANPCLLCGELMPRMRRW